MLIVEKEPKSPASEAYRTLRTNIIYSSFDKELKKILVTSSGPSEGKSTIVCNLAFTASEANKKVLILDCDLRKPSIHKKFGISNTVGLTNYLLGETDFESSIEKYNDNLHVMTSGTIPPNPVQMLSSNKLKEFIKSVEDIYDDIFIDSPPVLAATDAQILSTLCDGVVLAVASEQTERDMLLKTVDLLNQVKANILGTVLTKVKYKGKGYGYGYGYGYYYYYDENHEKKKKKKSKKVGDSHENGLSLSHNS